MIGLILTNFVFLWAGMILGISFLESWAKFRAPLLTKTIGLDVGRTVFIYFHKVEIFWLVLLVFFGALTSISWLSWILVGIITTIVILQIFWLFPILTQRVDALINGKNLSKSYAHTFYGISELVKLVLLLVLGNIFILIH